MSWSVVYFEVLAEPSGPGIVPENFDVEFQVDSSRSRRYGEGMPVNVNIFEAEESVLSGLEVKKCRALDLEENHLGPLAALNSR